MEVWTSALMRIDVHVLTIFCQLCNRHSCLWLALRSQLSGSARAHPGKSSCRVPGDGPLPNSLLVNIKGTIAPALLLLRSCGLDVLADAVSKHLPPLLDQVRMLHAM